MTKRTQLRLAFWVVLTLGALAVVAPFLPADILRARVESALTRSLHREVRVRTVHFTFFPAGPVPGPGFTLGEVTIHEDPRAGIEPFAYVQDLGVSIRVLSLLRGRLDLSGINLGNASVNLVKTNEGPWNFQLLAEKLASTETEMPAVRMRGGRVNFKFGDTKSAFFFNEADMDVALSGSATELRFSGAPRRTDHTHQDFGRFYARGTVSPSNQLDLQVELQRSSLEETLRLLDPQGFGVHGILALNARISGDPSRLDVTGKLEIGDIHRWDLLPSGETWQLPYKGTLDLRGERLNLESVAPAGAPQPVAGVRINVLDFLKTPLWAAGVDFHEMPLATLFQVAQHMGATMPEMLTVDGTASGSAAYDAREGLTGKLSLSGASLKLPERDALRAESASLEIRNGAVFLKPATILISPTQTAQLEGSVAIASPHALDLRVTTRSLDVAVMRAFGLAAAPVLGLSSKGTWKGWARYQGEAWSGETELEGASIAVDGFAEPLELESVSLRLAPNRVRAERIIGKMGAIAFSGSYDERTGSTQPAKFALSIPEADAGELERVLAPALNRAAPGFLARTLRLRQAPLAPAWLKARRAEGTITIDSFTAADWKGRALKTTLAWTGTAVRLTDLSAQLESAVVAGALNIDLAAPSPKYHFDGSFGGIAYRGGTLDSAGTLDAEGAGVQLLETAHGEGTMKGRGIAFAPEADFRALSAAFQLQAGITPRWKLTNVEATQAGATLLGTGVSQDDGRLLLDLTQGDRQVRFTGSIFAAKPASK